jgi:ATP adenylyltransferase
MHFPRCIPKLHSQIAFPSAFNWDALRPLNVANELLIVTHVTLGGMDYLWTPWRYAYVTGAHKPTGCIFCDAPKQPDADAGIVYRGPTCFIILNTFPYTSGHSMVVPYEHVQELRALQSGVAHELMDLTAKLEDILRQVYRPDGINLGMNIGQAAGAGVAGHIHMHVLPRWAADTNFMTTTAETRVLPEALQTTYERLKSKLQG